MTWSRIQGFAAALVIAVITSVAAPQPALALLPVHDGVGGEFSGQSSLGRVMRLSEFEGKVVLLFFGYTSCQDICPATLSHLRSLMVALDTDADLVQVLLVTVDPETDTAERLKEYLARFDARFIGITGTREETESIAAKFMVDHHRNHGTEVPMDHNRHKAFVKEGHLYSHSQQIYLLDKAGRVRAFFFTGSPVSEMKEMVRELIAE